jgi:hypothetical protein
VRLRPETDLILRMGPQPVDTLLGRLAHRLGRLREVHRVALAN